MNVDELTRRRIQWPAFVLTVLSLQDELSESRS
jgi:hypothetical protein